LNGVGIAKGFTDFLVVYGDEIGVEPVVSHGFTESGFGLGDFIGVMKFYYLTKNTK